MCGEKLAVENKVNEPQGSPPHVRGKVQKSQAVGLVNGITPACAGKSGRPHYHLILFKDHPRTCGEKKLAEFEDETGTGSPPRMRGKVFLKK